MAEKSFVEFKDKELRKFLSQLESRTSEMVAAKKAFAKNISPDIFQDVMDHFDDEMGHDGRWKKWSPGYRMSLLASKNGRKKKHGQSGKILQDTRTMASNFRPASKGTGNFRSKSGEIIWFNNTPYAATHDEGLDGMPQRSFMWLSDAGMERIAEKALFYALGGKS